MISIFINYRDTFEDGHCGKGKQTYCLTTEREFCGLTIFHQFTAAISKYCE
jgi:hypothetical protein